jgi:glucose-6-phosphate isomerase, archaeal
LQEEIFQERGMSRQDLFEPFGVDFDLAAGIMLDSDAHVVRRASSMRGYYQDSAALEELIRSGDDPVHYEVFGKNIPEEYGHLGIAVSKLRPGTVGRECFMTKGHYHRVAEAAEIYLCLRGEGRMLMKTAQGRCEVRRMIPGRLVYVPPYWAHRSVNCGTEALISLCIYPGEAGHNYGDIEKQGFPKRIYRRNGEIQILPV